MQIEVTQDHIDRGEPKLDYCCPIALALIEAGIREPRVDDGHIYAPLVGLWGVPGVITEFVDRFDRGLPVEPFSFEYPVE